MRIALLTDGIYPHVLGGMQKHSYNLCKYLAGLGVQIDLYHTTKGAPDPEEHLVDFTEAERACVRPFLVDYPKSDQFPGHYLRTSYQYSKRIFEQLQASVSTPDFIYAQGLTSWYLLQNRKKISYTVPVGINVHGYNMYQKAPTIRAALEQIMFKPVFRYINLSADWVFSFGGKIKEIVHAKVGVPNSQIIEIPNGISGSWMTDADQINMYKPRRFIYVGRYERGKGIQELLSAMLAVLKNGEPAELHIVGPIPYQLQSKHPAIFYHGAKSSELGVQQVLRSADVLVLPSYSEGMPTVILEAMACSCAVIATDVGAVRSMVNDEVGWLIPPANQAALHTALEAALVCPDEELHARKLAARSRVESSFLWEHVAQSTLAAIEKTLSFGHKGL
jgi:glycosyltransferase involved in cell wall biosynthesis